MTILRAIGHYLRGLFTTLVLVGCFMVATVESWFANLFKPRGSR